MSAQCSPQHQFLSLLRGVGGRKKVQHKETDDAAAAGVAVLFCD